MSVTMPRAMLMALLLSPSLSWALGLGEIHLNSSLNEPMNAEIDLLAATPDELAALHATLASRDAFARYGIDRPQFLTTLTFKADKSKDGRDALLVRSTDAIPEPFVTFLVEVTWARGRLMREYTVLLDPPVYAPGGAAAAPVTGATTPGAPVRRTAPPAAGAAMSSGGAGSGAGTAGTAASGPGGNSGGTTYRVAGGDTLAKIVQSLPPASPPNAPDQTMIAVYRSNPEAFGGNINVLRRGAILRLPSADQVAALNQKEAAIEVHRQMNAWRGGEAGADSGRLRLVTPSGPGSATGTGSAAVGSGARDADATSAEQAALRSRVKDLEGQLAETKRLIDIRNTELSALQRKLGMAPAPAATPAPAAALPPVAPAPTASAPANTPGAAAPGAAAPSPPAAAAPPVPAKPPTVVASPPAESASWIDWAAANWWVPVGLLVLVLGGVGYVAARRRQQNQDDDLSRIMDDTGVADSRDPTSKLASPRKTNESFVVEESGAHPVLDPAAAAPHFADTSEAKAVDDTLSNESAVNLDQGDPLAEADFHMAYGLYDQAADLVRIALEREPERRDLRMKLLEIYFVWGNKDSFLQTAKALEATRDRAPPGEWDKIIIMGKQICPEEPLFAGAPAAPHGAGSAVDLNLEGGENRVDIDLFGDPEGERSSLDQQLPNEVDAHSPTGEHVRTASEGLDFTLDAPERGADESPTRAMPPRDEPTVESELMNFPDTSTAESPALKPSSHDPVAGKLPSQAEQTAEVSLDDLGLDLDSLEQTAHPSMPALSAAAHSDDVHGKPPEEDMTDLERELEASFLTDLDHPKDELKTELLGPESAPTVLMPHAEAAESSAAAETPKFPELLDAEKIESDLDSTSKLKGIHTDPGDPHGEGIDLDLDQLAAGLDGETKEHARSAEEAFSHDIFEATQRNKRVDLDVGDALERSSHGADSETTKVQADTNRLKSIELPLSELEPVTMSEVGTKLDLARAYMDMGDPEGARNILEEVVQEGTASQKQEASRLIESLPG